MTSPFHTGSISSPSRAQGVGLRSFGGRFQRIWIGSWNVGLCFVFCLVGDFAAAEGTAEEAVVTGVRASKACITEEVRITGFAIARDQAGISLPLPGYRVTDIFVGEGDKVKAEQELLRAVRDEPADSSTSSASSRSSGPTSLSLKSPMAGTITQVNTRIGSISSAQPTSAAGTSPAAQIMLEGDTGADLILDVPSMYASRISKGRVARVIGDDGIVVMGRVRAPVSEVDSRTQLGRARLSLDPAVALRAGQFASAIVETASDCGVTVPRSAVSYKNGVATVQVLNGSAVEKRSVQTGLSDATRIQIRSGISEGQAIVANPGLALRPSDRVAPLIKEP